MKNALSGRIRLGAFQLDLKAGELHKDDHRIRLQEQPFQVLQMLVERAGVVVSRDEIQNKLWPNDTVVEFDHGINTAIKKLRIALNDSAEKPKYIETVARRGYRLMVPVEWPSVSSDTDPSSSEVSGGGDATAVKHKFESTSLTGKTVSHYRVLNIIGGGGMGVVYRAEDLKLGRAVALKFLPEELGSDPIALGRFTREARTASTLNHPNICTIHEIEEHEGQPFIVMEYLEGHTLRDLVAFTLVSSPLDRTRKPTLPLVKVLDIAIQIAEGLEAAHEKGIIHRDIKPANIFVTKGGQVKILDFGLAKLITATRETASEIVQRQGNKDAASLGTTLRPESDSNLTRVGLSIGTAGYMSPEQIEGTQLDARTDLFCFGLVLYELVSGQKAFIGATRDSLRDAILHRDPIPVRELNPDVPPKLEAVVTKCLQKDRERRYQHASEITKDLKQLRRETGSGILPQKQVADRIAQIEKIVPRPPQVEPENTKPGLPGKWLRKGSLAALVFAVAAGLWYWQSHRPRLLTADDTIVVADFANSTGDPVFDDALKTALTVDLQQSPSLKLLSDPKVSAALKGMNRSANESLTFDLAREVCLRTNSTAVLQSSIADVGNRYRLAFKVVNCRTGIMLANADAEAENRNQIVRVMGEAGDRLRAQLGEPKTSLEQFKRPLDEATSSSPEALQAFTRARKAQMEGPTAALPYLRRAVELDPNFAVAYMGLGVTYHNLGEVSLAIQNLRMAYQLRNRLPDRQRLAIETHYYSDVTGELEKAIQAYTELDQRYPGSWVQHNNVGELYIKLGQFEKSAAEEQESLRMMPDTAQSYNNLMLDYVAMNQLDDAQATFSEARARKVDGSDMRATAYMLAFLQRNNGGMQEQSEWAKGKSGIEDVLLSYQSDTEAYFGRMSKARQLSARAVESARQANAPETMASWKTREALREAEIGNTPRAREAMADARNQDTGRDADIMAAVTFARAGELPQAQQLVDKLDRDFAQDTLIQGFWLPTVRAAIELDRNPERAIAWLQAALPYELSSQPNPRSGRIDPMYPVYVRGLAYLKAGQGEKAAAEYQKMLDHPGVMLNFVTGALAHLQLGRALAMSGDKAGARKSYQDFLTLWKDADPDIPIYKQAKAEYAKLQ
jgi:eukaryotic-like serine/threonine-protein kinase